MRNTIVRIAVALMAVLGMTAVVASPASAITRVSCSSSTLHTHSISGDTCWSGTGTAWVTLYRVTLVDAGSRSGYVTYDTFSGTRKTTYFQAYDMVSLPEVTVRVIYRS
ncbi:hypothetical protein [Terrabacter sp. C0L_2]|jgi:hypothetical protein|uniref:hypothetical protein n=1 Tax=Terrabacter sp. C0L_2 TaxID=3108389 RepID=UPI002ED21191|nr:hypothetical protein U5C87_06960 [Terrabacter sp. C0L_2]